MNARKLVAGMALAAAGLGGAVLIATGTRADLPMCVTHASDGGFCRQRLPDGRTVPVGDVLIPADAGVGSCSEPKPCRPLNGAASPEVTP